MALSPLCCLFLSGRLRQVALYTYFWQKKRITGLERIEFGNTSISRRTHMSALALLNLLNKLHEEITAVSKRV